jgi:hypothetical protein
MFLGYQNEKIVLVANTKEELENTPCMVFDKIEETAVDYELYNGEYMPSAEAQAKREQAEKEAHIKDLKEQLDALDLKSLRALRAIQAGVGTEEDTQRIAALEEQAEEIREQLRQLGVM